ncbi:hypothetical protein BJ165DRAFT_218245 [Panaeolus papilionaceus]|nr:hypothetical protein BJ165DRAFT_218245 [Panaeolus papilionaceus]
MVAITNSANWMVSEAYLSPSRASIYGCLAHPPLTKSWLVLWWLSPLVVTGVLLVLFAIKTHVNLSILYEDNALDIWSASRAFWDDGTCTAFLYVYPHFFCVSTYRLTLTSSAASFVSDQCLFAIHYNSSFNTSCTDIRDDRRHSVRRSHSDVIHSTCGYSTYHLGLPPHTSCKRTPVEQFVEFTHHRLRFPKPFSQPDPSSKLSYYHPVKLLSRSYQCCFHLLYTNFHPIDILSITLVPHFFNP